MIPNPAEIPPSRISSYGASVVTSEILSPGTPAPPDSSSQYGIYLLVQTFLLSLTSSFLGIGVTSFVYLAVDPFDYQTLGIIGLTTGMFCMVVTVYVVKLFNSDQEILAALKNEDGRNPFRKSWSRKFNWFILMQATLVTLSTTLIGVAVFNFSNLVTEIVWLKAVTCSILGVFSLIMSTSLLLVFNPNVNIWRMMGSVHKELIREGLEADPDFGPV